MDEFTTEELKNIIYKHNITHIPYNDNQKEELWDIVHSYKINTPCVYDENSKGESWKSWLNTTIPFQLTIRDLNSMKHCDALEIIFLNKNFLNFENISTEANDNRNINLILKPRRFFLDESYKTSKSYIYIHNKEYNGIINFGKEWKSFDWQVEIYPGEFKTIDEMKREFGEEYIKNLNPDLNTRVGWTGPTIAVKNLIFCPDIIF